MNNKGHIIIDGPNLLQSINDLQRSNPKFQDKKLDIAKMSKQLINLWGKYTGSITRVSYYFKNNENRLKTMLQIPKSTIPKQKNHWRIIEYGINIRDSIPKKELDKLDSKYHDHISRSEKGLDIKLACDALHLLANHRCDNFVFLVNDRDYIPLFEAIHSLGGNIYLTALTSKNRIQDKLTDLSDYFQTLDDFLDDIFSVPNLAERKE